MLCFCGLRLRAVPMTGWMLSKFFFASGTVRSKEGVPNSEKLL